jgi:hypothetical protein
LNSKCEENKSKVISKQEECPECEDKFPDLKSLSEHFDTVHEVSDSESESSLPRKVKGKAAVKPVEELKVKSVDQEAKASNSVISSKSQVSTPNRPVLRSKVDNVKSKAELAQEMKKEIQKRIDENALKKRIDESAAKNKQDVKNLKFTPESKLSTPIQNNSLKSTSTSSQGQSSNTSTRRSGVAPQKPGNKKKVELLSVKKAQPVVSSKLSDAFKKGIPASSKFEKEAKLSQLRNLGVSVVKTQDFKNGRNLNKPSNWMEG